MGKTIIYYGNLVTGDPTITVSTTTTGYEKKFLRDYTPSSKWQATAALGTVSIDYLAAVYQAAIWAGGSNATSTSTLHKYGVGAAAAANTVEKTFPYEANVFSEIGETYRYGKYSLTNAADLSSVGKLYVAQYKFELPKDIKRGYSGGTMTQWITNKGAYGQIHKEKQYSKVIYQFEISGMGDAQKEILDETIRIEENVIFWDGETQKAYFGSIDFGQPKFIKSDITGGLWSISGTFEEAL